MSAVTLENATFLSHKVRQAVSRACDTVAPNWPLDKMIAVNPYWKVKEQPFIDVSAHLAAIAGIRSVMAHDHWLSLYQHGQISDDALNRSLTLHNSPLSLNQLLETLSAPPPRPDSWKMPTALYDQHRDETQMQWHEETLYQASQFCAAYFHEDAPVDVVNHTSPGNRLYLSWKKALASDTGVSILMGIPSLSAIIASLPDSTQALFEASTEVLELEIKSLDSYFQALLFSINGWAAYIAYRNWHEHSDEMEGLLAIALAWEWIIHEYHKRYRADVAKQVSLRWHFEQLNLTRKIQQHKDYENVLWVCMSAFEQQQQQKLQQRLTDAASSRQPQPAEVQALFCIDVRSEVMRRALEAQSDTIQTAGFAGFFGMPVDYQPAHTGVRRPQLPGLIQAPLTVTEIQADTTRTMPFSRKARWHDWAHTPVGGFSMVESAGWWYAFSLLRKMWFPGASENPVNALSHHGQWTLTKDGETLDADACAALAAGIIRLMGITRFAPTVLLIGHASHSANNLHAAGLDCGACGGQSGEVNVRVLAMLLNDKAVRQALTHHGIELPANTRFIAGLHNTTTDNITCFDDNVPARLQQWLIRARTTAQAERSVQFQGSIQFESDRKRHRLFSLRSRDWSQVQPEWGLAGNQAFIMAPRSWTRHVTLDGQCFLHDYLWQQDTDSALLEQLMTAPMVVTNWINMQYNASVTDNDKFGSGNKVLHNAVGEHIGVFEGNSGDLRIGLSRQSLHNGERWMHLPQRLSVYIAAPNDKIAEVIARHPMLQSLINNDWLYLFSWDRKRGIERWYQGVWYHSAGLQM
ncbi:YbcC family protein [Alteromonas sp. CYL-A6]|uniref:YbcC family protein n=1 Tax=Alteromonas nitratireducens TaxID=3390813 RepID=UPI0034B5DA49